MLDKQDLQAIKELIDTSIVASEERMKTYVDDSIRASESRTHAYIDGSIRASEERTHAYIDDSIRASEERTHAYIDDSVRTSESRLQSRIDAVDNKWSLYAENVVAPNFKLLAEGQQTILETLAPKSRVEALEDEVVFIKSVIKTMNQEIAELKKAQ